MGQRAVTVDGEKSLPLSGNERDVVMVVTLCCEVWRRVAADPACPVCHEPGLRTLLRQAFRMVLPPAVSPITF
jgi:hypothetical protein